MTEIGSVILLEAFLGFLQFLDKKIIVKYDFLMYAVLYLVILSQISNTYV